MLQIHLLCVRKLGVSLRTACPSFTETHKTLRQHFSTHSHSTTTGCHVIWLQFGRSNQLFLIHQGCDLHIRSEALHWFGLRTVDLVYNISLTKLLVSVGSLTLFLEHCVNFYILHTFTEDVM